MTRARIRAMKVLTAFMVFVNIPIIGYVFILLPVRERIAFLCLSAIGATFPASIWWFEFRSGRKK